MAKLTDTIILGDLVVTGKTRLKDDVTIDQQVSSDFIPDVDDSYDLGSATKRFANIYSMGLTVYGQMSSIDTDTSNTFTLGNSTNSSAVELVASGESLQINVNSILALDIIDGTDVDFYRDVRVRGSTPILYFRPTSDTQQSRINFEDAAGNIHGGIQYDTTSDYLRYYSNVTSSEWFKFDSTGLNVTENISTGGTIIATGDISTVDTGTTILKSESTNGGSSQLHLRSNTVDWILKNQAGNDLILEKDGTDKFWFDGSSNRLGIGIDPATPLHVYNSSAEIRLQDTGVLDAVIATYSIYDNNSALLGYFGYGSSSNSEMVIFNNRPDDIVFYTGGTERLRVNDSNSAINVSGKLIADSIGIGEGSPDNDLHIASSNPTIRFEDTDGTSAYAQIQIDANGSIAFKADPGATGASSSLIDFEVDGTRRARLSSSGLSLSSGAVVSSILDEDTMSSNSASALATQQSIKAYVDAQISGGTGDAGTLDGLDSTQFLRSDATDSMNGNLTVNGQVTFNLESSDEFILEADVEQYVLYHRNASNDRRYGIYMDNAEAGSNAGYDYRFIAFDDANAQLGDVYEITRSTQVMNFSQTPTVDGVDIWHANNFDPTALNGSNITSGTIDEARLDTNVVRRTDTFTSQVTWDIQSDFTVQDSTDTATNFIWRDRSAKILYLGTNDAAVEFRGPTPKMNGGSNLATETWSSSTFVPASGGTFTGDLIITNDTNITFLNGSEVNDGTRLYRATGNALRLAYGTNKFIIDAVDNTSFEIRDSADVVAFSVNPDNGNVLFGGQLSATSTEPHVFGSGINTITLDPGGPTLLHLASPNGEYDGILLDMDDDQGSNNFYALNIRLSDDPQNHSDHTHTKFLVNAEGNLLINYGTTLDTGYWLDVNGSGRFTGDLLMANQVKSIAGATWDNGWFKIGTSGAGWAFDSNEMYNAGSAIIGTLTGDMTFDVAGTLNIGATNFQYGGNTIWHEGNFDPDDYLRSDQNDTISTSGNTTLTIESTFTNSSTGGLLFKTVGDSSATRITYQKSGVTQAIQFFNHAATNTNSTFSQTISGKVINSFGYSSNAIYGRLNVNTTSNSTPALFENTNGDTLVFSDGGNGYGSFYARGSGTNSAYLFLGNVTSGERGRVSIDDNGNLFLQATSTNTIIRTDGGTERGRFNSSGLEVVGDIEASGVIRYSTSGTQIDGGGITLATGDVIDHNSTSSRDKIRVWSNANYTIGMQNTFTYGYLNNDYAMTFQMSNTTDRGFWWGHVDHTQSQGAMSLTTDGRLFVDQLISINGNIVWHAGNHGNGSGLDADLLDGYQPNGTSVANTVALRDSSSDIHARLFRSTYNTQTGAASTADIAFRNDTSDNYIRFLDGSGFVTWLTNHDGSGSGLDADLLDGQHGSSYASLSGADFTDSISSTGRVTAGLGGGGIALTINDGYGNANICFNHAAGVPEQNGNAARIEVNTDSTSGAYMSFELLSNVTNGAVVSLTSVMNMTEDGLQLFDNKILKLGTGNDAELFFNGSNTYFDLNAGNWYIRNGTTTAFTFTRTTGSFTATGDVTAYSDETLKNFINIIDRSSLIDNLQVYDFEWKDGRGTSVGVSAQDVQKIIPELVTENEDGILSLDYGKYAVATLFEEKKKREILEKETRSEIDKLKEEVFELKQTVQMLIKSKNN